MKRTLGVGVAGCLALFFSGCGSPAPDESTPAGTATGSPDSARAGSGASQGADPGGSALRDDLTRTAGPVDPIDDLPGVDPSASLPPRGCEGGSSAGALLLELDGDVPSVRLEASGGRLLANGVVCSDTSGAAIAPEALSSLRIEGATEDNAVLWDLGAADWSQLLAAPESVQLVLGSGQNSFVVTGSDGPDHFRHGMRAADVVLDLKGDGRIHVVGQGVTALGVRLAAGDDRLEDLAGFLAAASGEQPADPPEPTSGAPAPAPVTALSVPLLASGGDGDDWLVGGSAADVLDGGPGDDTLSGLGGDDTFLVASERDGTDTLNGGPGYDQVSYDERINPLEIQLCLSDELLGCSDAGCSCSYGSGESSENDRLVNLEDVTGGHGDDTLRGSDAAESLSGGPGDDSLFGLGGSDVLYGQGGNDLFDGGPDGDHCDARVAEASLDCEL